MYLSILPRPSNFPRLVTVLAALFFCSAVVHGQERDLNLFEGVERSEPVQRPDNRNQSREESRSGSPEFTLVGTSRFGDTYRARIRSSNGDVITIDAEPNSNINIPGHPDYRVADVRSRYVAIMHPSDRPCREFPDEGVSCGQGGNIARLEMATAAPIERDEPADRSTGDGQSGDQAVSDEEEAEEADRNPFRAALRAREDRSEEDRAALRAQAERFEQRRIDPDDVPPGRRVVRTPFGDRIIDE